MIDSSVLGSLIGGGIGCIVSWGAIIIFYLAQGDRNKRRERLVHGRVVSDKHLTPMFGNAISNWERVFSWKPVWTVDHGYVFCRYVWRRRIAKHSHLDGGDNFWFQYLVKLQYVYD